MGWSIRKDKDWICLTCPHNKLILEVLPKYVRGLSTIGYIVCDNVPKFLDHNLDIDVICCKKCKKVPDEILVQLELLIN